MIKIDCRREMIELSQPNIVVEGGIIGAIRRFTGRMIQPAKDRSVIVFNSGERITITDTSCGATELDAKELYKSSLVCSLIEHMRKRRKSTPQD